MLAGWMDVSGPNKEFGVVDFADRARAQNSEISR
jgi:hypothetical protein